MREQIIERAKKFDADIVTFTSAESFLKDDAIFKIFPEVKTVVALGFRVLRGLYRGIEEGTVYYQYTTMGVENLEETVMPYAMLQVANVIENADFIALPQRRHQQIMAEKDSTNPEVDYSDIYRGVTKEIQMDFERAAEICGIGEIGLSGHIINKEYGPFIRYCFVLTDAEIEPTKKEAHSLCDRCGECIKACPGKAISENGIDPWQCAVYYNGASGSKNPFMPPEAYADFENREDIIMGNVKVDSETAKEIMESTYFYPPAKHNYRSSICGRSCDRACYIHLEEKGVLSKKFKKTFRQGEDWTLSTEQFNLKK